MKMLLLISFILVSVSLTAQLKPAEKDSLWHVWSDENSDDSLRYQAIYIYAQKGFLYSSPDSAFYFGQLHLNKALSEHNEKEIGMAWLTQGISYAVRGTYDSCLVYFHKSLEIHDQIGYEPGAMKSSFNLGNLYRIQGDTINALKHYGRSERSSIKLHDSTGLALNLNVQSKLLMSTGKLDSALYKIDSSIEINSSIENFRNLSKNLMHEGDILKRMGRYDAAMLSYTESIAAARRVKAEDLVAASTIQLSVLNERIGEFETALSLAEEAILAVKKIDYKEILFNAISAKISALNSLNRFDDVHLLAQDLIGLSTAMNDPKKEITSYTILAENALIQKSFLEVIKRCNSADSIILARNVSNTFPGLSIIKSKAYLALNDLENALHQANTSLKISKKLNIKPKVQSSLKLLSTLHNKLGNSALAYSYLKQAHQLLSEIETAKNERAILKSNYAIKYQKQALLDSINYAFEERVLLAENKTQKEISYAAILGSCLLAFFAFFLFKSRKTIATQRDQISISLLEKDTLLREIHHRVKNNLQVVSSLLRLQTRSTSDLAAKNALNESQNRVQSMSLIHQNLYEKENLTGIRMQDYLINLAQNLFDTYNVDKEKVRLTLDIQDLNLDIDTVVPLGLIINELVSNALKYAFPQDMNGQIDISLKEENRILILKVKDNGVGFPQEKVTEKGNSFGFTLIHSFLKKMKASLEIITDNGTSISLAIKKYKIQD